MQFPKVSLDLEYGQGSCYGPEEEAAVVEVIRAGAPGYGPKSREFEQAFAEYCGVSHALAVSSGTAALQLAMLAAEVGPGDEVITTPLSWSRRPTARLSEAPAWCSPISILAR